MGKFMIKHGQYGTRLYFIWGNMIYRCENSNASNYKYYGGRGIKVCPEWRKDFMTFREWAITHGYKYYLTIDRINNNGDYMPENCRFVTRKEQNRNSRNNRYLKIGNEIKMLVDWAKTSGISVQTLRYRINAGWFGFHLLKPARRYRNA